MSSHEPKPLWWLGWTFIALIAAEASLAAYLILYFKG